MDLWEIRATGFVEGDKKRGYKLSADPEQRVAFSQSLEDYYPPL